MRRNQFHGAGGMGRFLVVALTINASVLWAIILAQAAFAGSFLSGTGDALGWHERNAAVIGFGSLGQLVLATLAAMVGSPRWPVVVTTLIFLAVGNQISLGYDRDLDVHVPLGVGLFGAQTGTTLWLLRRRLPHRPSPSPHGSALPRQEAGRTFGGVSRGLFQKRQQGGADG